MQQGPPPDAHTPTHLAPELAEKLDCVLRKIQEHIAVARSPGQRFALIHLVEDLSLADWQKVARELNVHGWLAVPLDEKDTLPLLALRETLEELAYQRDHDMLTGLANRRFFDRKLQFELERAYRTATPLSLALIDIDNFKIVNDTHGHATGDKVLEALGALLMNSLRIYDVAARIGGEEFCIILPGARGRQAVELTRRILVRFSEIVFESPEGIPFSVTFSAGVATASAYPEIPATELLAQADEYLYDAKSQGKNRVVSKTSKHKTAEASSLVLPIEKQFLFTRKT